MFGLKFKSDALARQELLVVFFYVIRTVVRFLYERYYGIISEFRFWQERPPVAASPHTFARTLPARNRASGWRG